MRPRLAASFLNNSTRCSHNSINVSVEFSSPSLRALQEQLRNNASFLMEGLWEAPKTLILQTLQKIRQTPTVVITPDQHRHPFLNDAPFFHLTSIVELLSSHGNEAHLDLMGQQVETLHRLLEHQTPWVVVCSLDTFLKPLPSRHDVHTMCHPWKVGDVRPFLKIPLQLQEIGYHQVPLVVDKGQFAVRGGILDIFPITTPEPYRIEFFGDTIDNIRAFDPVGQVSVRKVSQFLLTPTQVAPSDTLLSYLGNKATIVLDQIEKLEDRHVELGSPPCIALATTCPHPRIFWSDHPMEQLSEVATLGSSHDVAFECFGATLKATRWRSPFIPATELHPASRIYLVCEHEGEQKALQRQFPHPAGILPGYLSSGFGFLDDPTVVFPASEQTHRTKIRRHEWRHAFHATPQEFHEFTPGELVVHVHQGIGKYLGTEERKNHQGVATEFLVLEYHNESKLYVPASQAYLISSYVGVREEEPSLDTIGGKRWLRTKTSAQKAIVGYAKELLQVSAERELRGGFHYPSDSDTMMQFELQFPYPATQDQVRAIDEIKSDMMSAKAMDRLLCGDVGYGKTEVAMRAAFKAVVDGKKQVAVLVPTTLLALQHFETFSERMEGHPVTIRAISRFHTRAQTTQTLNDLKRGAVDIVIGTHRLLSKDISFHDLGLIIVDEEQRFGVRAKEHLKRMKIGVDCLTLTATPIPRTLYLSMMGARDVSLLNTPPQDRLPVKIILAERDATLIKEAMQHEFGRRGQVYFVHNRVESIQAVAHMLRELIPTARLVVGHGQMSGEELDAIFHTFKQGHADILLATSIIENGVDIPNANTILIDRSDQFGLTDLYQLKGRVGRWDVPAYAYFLIPPAKALSPVAKKRLSALTESGGVQGGGMKIALRDLQIRGAGTILGTEQSGQASDLGFQLYCSLLKRAVQALKRDEDPTFLDTKLECPFDAKLPSTYVPASSLRLELYHRLGNASSIEEVDTIFHELKDRFGTPPLPALWLYHLTRIKTVATHNRYTMLKFHNHSLETEQLSRRGTIKRSHPLKPPSSPAHLEEMVLPLLTLDRLP